MCWLTADLLLLQGVFVRQKKVMPRPLTPGFFSDRIANIDNATSAAMYHALQGANLLDLHDKLLADPRCALLLDIYPLLLTLCKLFC